MVSWLCCSFKRPFGNCFQEKYKSHSLQHQRSAESQGHYTAAETELPRGSLFSAFWISREGKEILSATLQMFKCSMYSPFPLHLPWWLLVVQMEPGAFEFHCCRERACLWSAGWSPPAQVQNSAVSGGWVCMEGSSRNPGTRTALEWQPSRLWWKQGSMLSARVGAFREPRTVPMESCEEASIINRNAHDREIKADYSKWKNVFWIQERPHKKSHEATCKDSWTKFILYLNSLWNLKIEKSPWLWSEGFDQCGVARISIGKKCQVNIIQCVYFSGTWYESQLVAAAASLTLLRSEKETTDKGH